VIVVRPSGTNVIIDGQRRPGPAANERLVLQLDAARHRIEVERSGYETYSTEVDVARGESITINVSLRRK
jgi:hypothetical protein